jgi:hypothetical protein
LLTSTEKISLAEIQTNGVSSPIAFETAIANAVLPEPGVPAIKTARPAIFPS